MMAHKASIFIWMWSAVDKALGHWINSLEVTCYIMFLFLFYTASQLFGNQGYTLSNKDLALCGNIIPNIIMLSTSLSPELQFPVTPGCMLVKQKSMQSYKSQSNNHLKGTATSVSLKIPNSWELFMSLNTLLVVWACDNSPNQVKSSPTNQTQH